MSVTKKRRESTIGSLFSPPIFFLFILFIIVISLNLLLSPFDFVILISFYATLWISNDAELQFETGSILFDEVAISI